MRKPLRHIPSTIRILAPLYIVFAVLFTILIRNGSLQLLEPAGYIATIQSHILYGFLIFATIIAVLLISSFFYVALRFQESKRNRYQPEWHIRHVVITLVYAGMFVVISGASVMLWATAHQVDPYRPIDSSVKPVTIQVVALRWKWLFLYPDNHVATVNMLEIPVGTPVAFQLTADAPMNSFWIPKLSGQVYAMNGMVTKLHIQADKLGTYAGSPAEMSGDGFAGMRFTVKAVSTDAYAKWLASAQRTPQQLNYTSYLQLARPSSYNPEAMYRLASTNLFDTIVMQFMRPGADPSTLQVQGQQL